MHESQDKELDGYQPFPSGDFMKSFKIQDQETNVDEQGKSYQLPTPELCLIQLIKAQLMVGNKFRE